MSLLLCPRQFDDYVQRDQKINRNIGVGLFGGSWHPRPHWATEQVQLPGTEPKVDGIFPGRQEALFMLDVQMS